MFEVFWHKLAEDSLAAIWSASASGDRSRVARASDELDRLLAAGADSLGESRSVAFRVAFEGPLRIDFEVRGHTARVVSVGLVVPRRGRGSP